MRGYIDCELYVRYSLTTPENLGWPDKATVVVTTTYKARFGNTLAIWPTSAAFALCSVCQHGTI